MYFLPWPVGSAGPAPARPRLLIRAIVGPVVVLTPARAPPARPVLLARLVVRSIIVLTSAAAPVLGLLILLLRLAPLRSIALLVWLVVVISDHAILFGRLGVYAGTHHVPVLPESVTIVITATITAVHYITVRY